MTSTKPVPATQQPKTAPAQAASTAPKAKGKPKATEAELATREAARKAETPAQTFQRIARPRLGKVLDAMRLLETVGNNYEYSPEQAQSVLQYLVDGVARVKVAFSPKARGSKAAQELPQL